MGSSALILYNEQGQVLLQLRSAYKKNYANCWGLFGGHIEEGETPEEALMRELQEELAYIPKAPTKFKISPPDDVLTTPLHVYYEQHDTSQTLIPDARECQEMRWFSPEDILSLDSIIPADKKDVIEFCKHMKWIV